MGDIDLDPEDRQAAADEAFLRAMGGYTYREIKLQPFSALRQAAALNMGLVYGTVEEFKMVTVTNSEGKKEKVPTYPQFFQDIVYVLWLCSVDDDRAEATLSDPKRARKDALQWATDLGLTAMSADLREAADVFSQIMVDISTSATKPKIPKDRTAPTSPRGKE